MTAVSVAGAIGAVIIVTCLLSCIAVFLLWVAVAALTIAGNRNRERQRPPILAELAHGASVRELAEIDDELDRILAREG